MTNQYQILNITEISVSDSFLATIGLLIITFGLHDFTFEIPRRWSSSPTFSEEFIVMKCSIFHPLIFPLLFLVAFMSSCDGQEKAILAKADVPTAKPVIDPKTPADSQVADYVRNIYQDKNGALWFGSNGYGVAHYRGDNVVYFSPAQGFAGNQITGITEDLEKNIWFATDLGVVKYSWASNNEGEKLFTNYAEQQFFDGHRFWSIFADSKGNIWAGSVLQIYKYDGLNWLPFALPFPEEVNGEFITKGTTWSISEDAMGNMWFSTNGFGAYKYDGQSFTQFSKEDGLTDNSVDNIMEDSRGNIWFGTRFGGVSRYDGMTFTNYTEGGVIGNNEVCVIYEDSEANIWFSSEGYGVYRYDGESFTNFGEEQGLDVRAVQAIFEDDKGRFWVGGGGGLYRFDGSTFFNVKRTGPWE